MRVAEIMNPNAVWIAPDLSVAEAARKMRDLNVGALPVGENDRLIGMVTDRDITCRAIAGGLDPATASVREVMSERISYCFDDQEAEDAAQVMERKQMRRLPVVNRDKRLVGFLSVGDLAIHCPHDLSGEVLEAVSTRPH